jgi:phosphate uptake regulator
MKVTERNVQEIGKSFLVTLPKSWAKTLKIKKGSKLKMLVSESGSLSIAPEFVQKEKPKEVIISYDEHFNRRFFREYFGGNEKIIIKFIKKITENQRKKLYAFLKRFMNTQIIEETESKVIIKCFTINELSMDECLKRMYFLSLNLIDEIIGKNDGFKVKEIRDTMTRFYYMLIMQVRRFLSEGKFVSDKQIPIIRAMDLRMVAEKIQRLAEIIEHLDRKENIGLIKDYYSKSFSYFINNDFEKALPLWQKAKSLQEKTKKDANLMQLLRYSKEISMLVR